MIISNINLNTRDSSRVGYNEMGSPSDIYSKGESPVVNPENSTRYLERLSEKYRGPRREYSLHYTPIL